MNPRFLILSGSFVFLMVVLHFASTYQHELIHQVVYERYGIESNIDIIYNPITMVKTGIAGRTKAIDNSTLCDDNCNLAQSMAEIVGYNNEITQYTIMFMAFMLLMVYLTREKKHE